VWSPLASGFLSGKYRRGQPPPAGARLAEWKDTMRRIGEGRSYDLIELLDKVAKRHSATPAQISLAWLLGKKEVSSVILGARTTGQLDDNMRASEVKLSDEDMKELDAASAPDWAYPYAFIARSQPW
jgi:aryl-alcohol dehydrogenase-like predicted oxidoreductase